MKVSVQNNRSQSELFWEERALERGDVSADERAILDRIHASNEEILAQYPVAMMSARIASRIAERRKARRVRRAGFGGAFVLAGAVAVLLLTVGPIQSENRDLSLGGFELGVDEERTEVVRSKGLKSKLHIYRKLDDRVELLNDGKVVANKDLLQLSYSAADSAYGVIVSVDGRGQVSLHHPEKKDGSTQLKSGGEVSLPHSYLLDDAPEFERFFFVTAQHPIEVQEVLDAVEGLKSPSSDPLRLSPEIEQQSVRLEKVKVR